MPHRVGGAGLDDLETALCPLQMTKDGKMVKRLLIANRGEIAIRIARTAEAMGIETIALYSEDDETALHRLRATRDVALKGSGPAAYLDQEQVLRLARDHGADAIHPGYGFLSENAGFAARCAEVGIRFIGPSPEVLTLFGDKALARDMAQRCGVPVPLGTGGGAGLVAALALFDQGVAALMVKAVSGGGGRGMRLVRRRDQLEQAMADASAEAVAAIGIGDVYVEEFIPNARHIEVQVIGDGQHVVHAGERECTLQRRHQKVIEFAPSPHLAPALRAQIAEAALTMARAVHYSGLGTFEFLVSNDPDAARPFAFIECNPRLQVEHTVTEQVMGIDLVEAQIGVASGMTLADLGLADLSDRAPSGAALQLRISMAAPGPQRAGRTQTNRLDVFDLPSGPGVRCDAAGYAGYRPSPRFDPLLGKIVVHEPRGDYARLLAKAARVLGETRIEGLATNLPLLRTLIAHPSVLADRIDTGFMDGAFAELSLETAPALRHFAASPAPGDAGPVEAAQVPEGWVAVAAPMAGSLVQLSVAEGDLVGPTTPVAIIEAMKMQNTVLAGVNGIVRRLLHDVGAVVSDSDPVLFIEPSDDIVADTVTIASIDLDHIPENLGIVHEALARTRDAARPAAVEKMRVRGKPTTRENLATLCDAGSFLEIGSLAVSTMGGTIERETARGISPADGLVCGYAQINSDLFGAEASRCMVMAFDPSVYGGTMGKIAKDKIERVLRIAKAGRRPLVLLVEGGGARSGESENDIRDGVAKMEVFRLMAELKGRLPLIGIVAGNCFAGHAAFAGLCDVIIATPEASIGMAGPAMIEGAGLGRYAPEEIGPASVHSRTGVVDILVRTEAEAMETARRYLSYFQGDCAVVACDDQRRLRHVVPADRAHVYDMRDALHLLADTGSVTELRADFGRAMITAFVRIDGMPVGVLASNPRHMGGAIDAEASDKAAHFMQHCNAFGLPIVSFVDTPGFMVGPAAEQQALVRRVSRMFVAGAQLRVPLFTCVMRKCYGLGGVAMNGGSQSTPLTVVAWPSSEFGAMNPEGSVEIVYRRELAQIANPEDRAALVRKYAEEFYEYGTALNMAKTGKFDEVIDPAHTRDWIATGLRTARPYDAAPPLQPYFDTW